MRDRKAGVGWLENGDGEKDTGNRGQETEDGRCQHLLSLSFYMILNALNDQQIDRLKPAIVTFWLTVSNYASEHTKRSRLFLGLTYCPPPP